MTYEFKRYPREHQGRGFVKLLDVLGGFDAFGLWWEMGTGKTKAALDLGCYLHENEGFDAILVIAPPNVDRKWVYKDVPKDVPDRIDFAAFQWQTRKRTQKRFAYDFNQFRRTPAGLKMLTITWPGLSSAKAAEEVATTFMREHSRVLLVLDESRRIKEFKSRRTKAAKRLGKLAAYRLAMSGTAVDNGPFDIFEQVRFLYPDYWRRQGFGTKVGFESHFGHFRAGMTSAGFQFRHCTGYRNLDELHDMLLPISDHVSADEALNLPPTQYHTIGFELTPKQRKHYDEIERDFVTFIEGGMVAAPMALTQAVRLQQASRGYLPDPNGEGHVAIDTRNPCLDAWSDFVDDVSQPALAFSWATRDIEQMIDVLRRKGKSVVRYDGKVSPTEQATAIEAFQYEKTADWFVGNPQAMAEGHDLYRAKVVTMFRNSLDLDQRNQVLARARRDGMDEHPVQVYDFVGENTYDEKIAVGLQEKKKVVDIILGRG